MKDIPRPTKQQVFEVLRPIRDPELGYSVVDLGLVYDAAVTEDGACTVTYTLTSPACPLADVLEREVRTAVEKMPGMTRVALNLTWEPAWSPEKITPSLRRELRIQGFPV